MIRKYPLRCYRLDENNVAQATVQRIGKYSGQVAESDGRQVPHGKGTFKTSTGYVWLGAWADGAVAALTPSLLPMLPAEFE